MKKWLIFFVSQFICTCGVIACPVDPQDPLHKLRLWADQAIVRIDTIGTSECTNTGTGFFINAAGDIITAGHVIPKECSPNNTTIHIRWSKTQNSPELSDPVNAHVEIRSSLDVALLRLDKPPDSNLQFLRLETLSNDVSLYKNRCILLASHYYEQTDAYSTFAEIASVALLEGNRWALSGDGFNPSRSGSPIILSNGHVVALFVARPDTDDQDRDKVIQNRAYILPIGNIPKDEMDFTRISVSDGALLPFLTLPNNQESVNLRANAPLNSFFGLSITEQGFRTDPMLPTFLYKNGRLSNAESLDRAIFQAGLSRIRDPDTDISVLRQITVRRFFQASPGYVFDPSTLSIDISSLNPTQAPLPTRLCDGASDNGCYIVINDGRTLELRINLYPGVDGRGSWIDSEIRIIQRPK